MENKQKMRKEKKVTLKSSTNSLEITKMKQGMSYTCKEKTIILNVFKYFRSELPDRCVTEIVRRTAHATGCSEKSVFQFRKEEASEEGFKEPSKTKIRKNININSRYIKYDNTVRQTIRSIIYDLQYKNIPPSLSTILKNVNAHNKMPNFSLMTLRRLMFDMGFSYEKNGNKSVLVDNPDTRYGEVYLTTQNNSSANKKVDCEEIPIIAQHLPIIEQDTQQQHLLTQPQTQLQSQLSIHQIIEPVASVPILKADSTLLSSHQQHQQQTSVPDHRLMSTMHLNHHHNNIRPQDLHEQSLMASSMHGSSMMMHPSRRNPMIPHGLVPTHHTNHMEMHVKREHMGSWMHPIMNKNQ